MNKALIACAAATAYAWTLGVAAAPATVPLATVTAAPSPVTASGEIPAVSPDAAKPPPEALPKSNPVESTSLRGTPRDPEYLKARSQHLPLTAEQIEDLRAAEELVDKAYAASPAPSIATASLNVTTRPGVAPQRINLADGFLTALSFMDNTGAPWPITKARVGNEALFLVETPGETANVAVITPKRRFAVTNLLVLLAGASAPIVLTLDNSQGSSFYNANVIVDQRGPNAIKEVLLPPPDPVDNAYMRAILDGAGGVTQGVQMVEIKGGEGTTAYFVGDKFYLRTPYRLIFPSSVTASMRSGSITVYELPVSPIITVADENGRPIDLLPSDAVLLEGALATRASNRP